MSDEGFEEAIHISCYSCAHFQSVQGRMRCAKHQIKFLRFEGEEDATHQLVAGEWQPIPPFAAGETRCGEWSPKKEWWSKEELNFLTKAVLQLIHLFAESAEEHDEE